KEVSLITTRRWKLSTASLEWRISISGTSKQSGKANLGSTIQLHLADWRHTLPTRMRIVCCKDTILHRQYGYMLSLIRLQHAESRFARYANLVFSFKI